jgi:hypothetical protein
MKKETLQFWKQFLLTALIMSCCVILFDFWEPLKQLVTGHYQPGTNLASYISPETDIPVILAVSVVLASAGVRRKKTTDK